MGWACSRVIFGGFSFSLRFILDVGCGRYTRPLERNAPNSNAFQNRVTAYNHRNNNNSGNGDGTKDAASDFSAIINSETVYVSATNKEMKTSSEYHGVPPPPSTLQREARLGDQTVSTASENTLKMIA